MALTFREQSARILLLLFVFGTTTAFSGSMLGLFDAQIQGENNDTVNKLNTKLEKIKPDTGSIKKDASTTGGGLGLVSTTTSTIGNVLSGIGLLPTLAGILVTELNFTDQIVLLAAIPAVAIIWEAISVYQDIRT